MLACAVDLSGMLTAKKKPALRALAAHATDPYEKAELGVLLNTDERAADLFDFKIVKNRYTLVDFLEAYPSICSEAEDGVDLARFL